MLDFKVTCHGICWNSCLGRLWETDSYFGATSLALQTVSLILN